MFHTLAAAVEVQPERPRVISCDEAPRLVRAGRELIGIGRMAATRIKATLGRGDAILVIDVINDLEFPGGEDVLPWARRLTGPLLAVCGRARRAGIPVIYVNDNFGLWTGGPSAVIAHCTRAGARGAATARRLKPKKADIFLLKPRHSAFFGTSLATLLVERKIRRVVLAGMATNLCVLITAHDAAMHGFKLIVASDCCAAESDFDHDVVLSQLKRFFHATICRSTELGMRAMKSAKSRSRRRL